MDKRTLKTKEKLRKAALELSRTIPLEEMSVSALCKKAGINRTTFYKYYAVPEDVLLEMNREMIDEMLEQMHREGEAELYPMLLKCCQKLVEKGAGNKNAALIDERMVEMVMDGMREPELYQNNEKLHFIAGGTAAVLERWLKEDASKRRSAREVAAELTGYIQAVLK